MAWTIVILAACLFGGYAVHEAHQRQAVIARDIAELRRRMFKQPA